MDLIRLALLERHPFGRHTLVDDFCQFSLRRRLCGEGDVEQLGLLLHIVLFHPCSNVRVQVRISGQDVLDVQAHGSKLLVHQVARLIELGDPGFGIEEVLGLEGAEADFYGILGNGQDAVVLVKLARANHVDQLHRVLDAVEDGGVHFDIKPVRGLNVSGFDKPGELLIRS